MHFAVVHMVETAGAHPRHVGAGDQDLALVPFVNGGPQRLRHAANRGERLAEEFIPAVGIADVILGLDLAAAGRQRAVQRKLLSRLSVP